MLVQRTLGSRRLQREWEEKAGITKLLRYYWAVCDQMLSCIFRYWAARTTLPAHTWGAVPVTRNMWIHLACHDMWNASLHTLTPQVYSNHTWGSRFKRTAPHAVVLTVYLNSCNDNCKRRFAPACNAALLRLLCETFCDAGAPAGAEPGTASRLARSHPCTLRCLHAHSKSPLTFARIFHCTFFTSTPHKYIARRPTNARHFRSSLFTHLATLCCARCRCSCSKSRCKVSATPRRHSLSASLPARRVHVAFL